VVSGSLRVDAGRAAAFADIWIANDIVTKVQGGRHLKRKNPKHRRIADDH